MRNTPNAKELVANAFTQAEENRKSQQDLIIWGGTFSDTRFTEFLTAWRPMLPDRLNWCIVEEVSRFYVRQAKSADFALPADLNRVERMRLFASDGDLDIRRDGVTLQWRFIGDNDANWPDLAVFQPVGFWQAYPQTSFLPITQCYYQWRRTREEQRVTDAWLEGVDLPKEGVYLEQVHYLENGRTAFVRYVGFEAEGEIS